MGSTGTNRFTDYPGTPRGSAKSDATGNGAAGANPEIDQCDRELVNVPLEEMARCEYFAAHHNLPPVGEQVVVRAVLVGGRMGVETVAGREVIGLLPTEYNYLLQCMKQGYVYAGQVKSASPRPIPVVRVDLEPRR